MTLTLKRIGIVLLALGIITITLVILTVFISPGEQGNGTAPPRGFSITDPSTQRLILNTSVLQPAMRFYSLHHYTNYNMTPQYARAGAIDYWLLFAVSQSHVVTLDIFSFPEASRAQEFLHTIMRSLGSTPSNCSIPAGDECLSLSSTRLHGPLVAFRKGRLVARLWVQTHDGSLMTLEKVEQMAAQVDSALPRITS